MAENQILPFAQGTSANVQTQTAYAGDVQRLSGNQPGLARSAFVNKALRQALCISAGVGQYIADSQNNIVTDALTPQQVSSYLKTANASSMTGSNVQYGVNGYQKLPSGIIIQWGTALINLDPAAESGDGNITLPIAFTANVYTVNVTPANNFYGGTVTNAKGVTVSAYSMELTRFSLQFFPNDTSKTIRGNHYFRWIAIGR